MEEKRHKNDQKITENDFKMRIYLFIHSGYFSGVPL